MHKNRERENLQKLCEMLIQYRLFPTSNIAFADFVDVFPMQSESKNAYYGEGTLT